MVGDARLGLHGLLHNNQLHTRQAACMGLDLGIILCLAAYLRLKGAQLRRIADMVLLAYAVAFAVIAYLIINIKADEPLLQALLIIVALANIAASIASLWRKSKGA